MTYRYIYKITCTAGSFKGKFYYGQHTTENLDDGYTGSGILIRRYLKNYPDKYIKEIISFHNSQEELNQAEYDIIHPNLNNSMCLNLIEGGTGGALSEISRKKMSESKKGKTPWNKGKTDIYSKETIAMMSNSHKGKKLKPFSEEHRSRISESNKGKHKGYHHTQESKNRIGETVSKLIWINNGIINKRIHTNQLQQCLNDGFLIGRTSCWNKGKKLAWVTLDNKHKQIKEEELQKYIDAGWHRGRK